jgi:hypothetical protein
VITKNPAVVITDYKWRRDADEASVVRVCRVVGIQRRLWYYQSRKDDTEVIDRLNELAEQLSTREFDKYYDIIRLEGKSWERRRVLRVYREMNLKFRRKHRHWHPAQMSEPLQKQQQANKSYIMDFISDAQGGVGDCEWSISCLTIVAWASRHSAAIQFPVKRL